HRHLHSFPTRRSSDLATTIEHAAHEWARRQYSRELAVELARSGMFWKWWVGQWVIRDEDYLRETSMRFIHEPLTGYELKIALDEDRKSTRLNSSHVKI